MVLVCISLVEEHFTLNRSYQKERGFSIPRCGADQTDTDTDRDPHLPSHTENASIDNDAQRLDYGLFQFGYLFSEAIPGKPFRQLTSRERRDFLPRFEHKVSDYLPLCIWLLQPTR